MAADQAQRAALYREFQDIFAEELPALPLFYPVYSFGVRSEVHDVTLARLNEPSDRFRTLSDWYLVTRRVTVRDFVPGQSQTRP
jgi:peptide/nickel transport system substrate-binding protein